MNIGYIHGTVNSVLYEFILLARSGICTKSHHAAVDRSYLAVPIDRCDTGLRTFAE